MGTSVTFGRRAPPTAGAARPAPATPAAPAPLSPEAEAFRARLAGAQPATGGFERWRRETRAGRWAAWAGSGALMVSGAASFAGHAPAWVSAALEVGGWVLGWRLRRARRERLAAVRSWEG